MKRRVLITGAGSGIGAALANAFVERGDEVIGTVRDAERARALSSKGEITFHSLELLDPQSIEALARELTDVDILVNNAGAGLFGAVEDVDAQRAARQVELNLLAPLALTRLLLPTLRARRGRVAFVGSLAGRFALPFQAHYSATKAALASMSDALRMELRPFGVQVTCIEADDFRTAFTDARARVQPEHSAYSAMSEPAWAAALRTEREAPTPEKMARQVARMLTRKKIPARYPVGENARFVCFLGRVLPDSVRERVIRGIYKV